jgi:hypothetical protein
MAFFGKLPALEQLAEPRFDHRRGVDPPAGAEGRCETGGFPKNRAPETGRAFFEPI